MKKVLSVAMASAMVLGMGANAFAIQYSTGSNDKADWPKDFKFAGELFVTDKDDKIIEESTTALNDSQDIDFQPGDTIWMPLYADGQKVYDSDVTAGIPDVEAKEEHKVVDGVVSVRPGYIVWKTGSKYYANTANAVKPDLNNEITNKVEGNVVLEKDGHVTLKLIGTEVHDSVVYSKYEGWALDANKIATAIKDDAKNRRYYIGGTRYANVDAWANAINAENAANAYVTEVTEKVEGTDTEYGKPIWNDGKLYDDVHYTGNIDKNWSINLIEKEGTVSDLIEKAELYKADKNDYHSYKAYTNQIKPNAVYLRVTLKDEWKTIDKETLKYYVYLADNKGNRTENEVWVSGTYKAPYKTVDFTWSNDASKASLWKAEENGTAVFDFADKAFFTVKMYKGETMYLDLNTAYNKILEGEFDAEFDSFYKFDNNANFAREGELVIASGDDSLVVYEVTEEGLEPIDAEYVKDEKIAGINKKVSGFKFNTKQLGNYVLSEELAEEEEVEEEEEAPEVDEEEAPEVDEPEVNEVPETNKPNPDTGAEDFVGLAVSLAVVSVAAAGALALKK